MPIRAERSVHVVLIEDSSSDAAVIQRALSQSSSAFEFRVVDSAEAFESLLGDGWPDVFIGDYTLPGWDGAAALALAAERKPEVPFLFVSGTIGEERAAELIRLGAADYVLKDRLSRLPHAVNRALELAEERRERTRQEAELAEFTWVASHDLQESLRTIASHLELWGREYGGRLGPEADQLVERAVLGARHMHARINGLLARSPRPSPTEPPSPATARPPAVVPGNEADGSQRATSEVLAAIPVRDGAGSQPLRILIVEDNDDHAQLAHWAFEETGSGALLERASSGEEALDRLRRSIPRGPDPRPDVVLLDLRLSGVSGHRVLETVKADPLLRSIPVIVLSTTGSEADRVRAFASGANSYLVKPLEFERLVDLARSIESYWGEWNLAPYSTRG